MVKQNRPILWANHQEFPPRLGRSAHQPLCESCPADRQYRGWNSRLRGPLPGSSPSGRSRYESHPVLARIPGEKEPHRRQWSERRWQAAPPRSRSCHRPAPEDHQAVTRTNFQRVVCRSGPGLHTAHRPIPFSFDLRNLLSIAGYRTASY